MKPLPFVSIDAWIDTNALVTPWLTSWWNWICEGVLVVALGTAFLWCLDGLTRQRLWPQLRLALWSLILLKPLSTPVLALLGLDWTPPGVESWIQPSTATTVAPGATTMAPTYLLEKLLFCTWLVGVLACGWLHHRRGKHSETAACAMPLSPLGALQLEVGELGRDLGLRRIPPLMLSPSIDTPLVFGVFQPRLLLPSPWAAADRSAQRQHAFAHELLHLKRWDLLQQQLLHFLHLLFWFHPGSWWARRKTEELREVCCDSDVTQHSPEDRREYRRTLLSIVSDRLRSTSNALGFGQHALLLRLYWLDRDCSSPWRSAMARTLFLAVSASFLPMAISNDAALDTETIQRTVVNTTIPQLDASGWDRITDEVLTRSAQGDRQSCLQLKYAALYKMARDNDQ